MNWTLERPLIFKTSDEDAHNLKETFLPGFGCTISEAVQASCSATPFFDSVELNLQNVGPTHCRDGEFAANNPSLFAITDALKSFESRRGRPPIDAGCRALSRAKAGASRQNDREVSHGPLAAKDAERKRQYDRTTRGISV